MATLVAEFPVVGRLGDYSAYRVKGSDKIIVRRKGGATKEKIRKDPAFEMTRRQNAEFSARAKCYSSIRRSLYPLKSLTDGSAGGRMNKLLKLIQDLDTVSPFGQRCIYLSRHGKWLEGFALNLNHAFDTILTSPVKCSITRAERRADVILPEMAPGINFIPPPQYPYYRFIGVLGIVPDMTLTAGMPPMERDGYSRMASATAYTDWTSTASVSPEIQLHIELPAVPPDEAHALVLGIGIEFGMVGESGHVRSAGYGSSKILAVA